MDRQPLYRLRVAVTRAAEQSESLAAALTTLGAEVLRCPTIAFAPPSDLVPLDAALRRLASFDWMIITSANAAQTIAERLDTLGISAATHSGMRIAAVGPQTTAALERHGLRPDCIPPVHTAEGLLEAIGSVSGTRILLPQADIARPALADGLRSGGALVESIVAYRTIPGAGAVTLAPLLRAGKVDAIVFTSPSTLRYLLDGLEVTSVARPTAIALLNQVAIVCIGPVTAAAALDEGVRVSAVAAEQSADGLVQALVGLFDTPE